MDIATKQKKTVTQQRKNGEQKKLSKFGEWMKANPKGTLTILDMRAVMK